MVKIFLFPLLIFIASCSNLRLPSVNPSTWISDSLSVLSGKTLKEITLPGTHDSGSYKLTWLPMPGAESAKLEAAAKVAEELFVPTEWVIKDWARSQDEDFYSQMQGGIRYFDLRCGWDNSTQQWRTFHFLIGNPIDSLLQGISKFLKEYPKEIVVVETSHYDGSPSENNVEALRDLVLEHLGEYLFPVNLSFNFTVGDMISSGKRAIVTMDHKDYKAYNIWPGDTIYNTYADSNNLETMISYNNKTVEYFETGKWGKGLFKISWTLTPNEETILETLLFWKPHSLIELADTANPALPQFVKSITCKNWRTGNILIIDHYDKSSILEVVLEMNGIHSPLMVN